MLIPIERPSELSALNWSLMGDPAKAWRDGEGGEEWSSYPEHIGSLSLVGEVSHYVRPTTEMFCETRTRGVFAGDPDDGHFLAFGYDWIHKDYRLGKLAKVGQVVGHNAKGTSSGWRISMGGSEYTNSGAAGLEAFRYRPVRLG